MGCISSKDKRSKHSPTLDIKPISANAGRIKRPSHSQSSFSTLEEIKEEPDDKESREENNGLVSVKKRHWFENYSGNLRRGVFSFRFGRMTEAEHVAAGWPSWLSAVAGEAVEGWLPMSSDMFERLDKIGQGTYSNVYRARDLTTGKIVALKKARFDNFHTESVRFMAREIVILRKLDHPNVMKLEGIITSRVSCSIYLVFQYMEHDLSGLLSRSDVEFTESQIKCYMQQLLSGIEHCHSRGVLHRDVKSSNILVNNEGVLKIGDFGLAKFVQPKNKEPLTSRVVTLWYRPPELLLGSTSYDGAVDLWSVGCVFAELFLGRPLLRGRNEVEQLHKIFRLCGSPSDEFWKKSKLPLATMFKPQQPYESMLRERCKELPENAVSLVETLLFVEPKQRGTASSALQSQYFTTKPRACDPSSLPKYPPSKELDAKLREEAKRKKADAGLRNLRRARKSLQESKDFFRVVPTNHVRAKSNLSFDPMSEASQMSQESQGSSVRSVPVQVSASTNFAWANRQRHNIVFTTSHDVQNLENESNNDISTKRAMRRQQVNLHQRPESFDTSSEYEPRDITEDYYENRRTRKVALSGPLMYQSQDMVSGKYRQPGEVLQREENSYDSRNNLGLNPEYMSNTLDIKKL